MQSLDLIKKRIKSIEATKKITNAMKLVATTKLRKQRKAFEAASSFCVDYYDIFQQLVSQNPELRFLRKHHNKDHSILYILISSDLGLCGAYNSNICKQLALVLKPKDKVIVFGQKGYNWLKAHHFEKQIVRNLHWELTDISYYGLLPLGVEILSAFANGKYEKVRVVYTRFETSIKYIPQFWDILPVAAANLDSHVKVRAATTIFEPGSRDIILRTLPNFISNLLFGALVESILCESYSRRFAMEGATKNATDLIEQLKVQYNQARQEAITQEINEIVAGAIGKVK